MATATQDLWPDDLAMLAGRTPLSILREQADLLPAKTKNLLEGEVQVHHDEGDLYINLNIVAPALDHYRYTLVGFRQPAELYPLIETASGRRIPDEATLLQYLRETLSSPKTRRVIGNLIAQSNAAARPGED